MNYSARFRGGSVQNTPPTIYTTDTLANKSLTLTFNSSYTDPGTGTNAITTLVHFNNSAFPALSAAVTGNTTVNLGGTQSGSSLTHVTHSP
jgi:hypothetical protein